MSVVCPGCCIAIRCGKTFTKGFIIAWARSYPRALSLTHVTYMRTSDKEDANKSRAKIW